jgi:RND family efflux transporter MFP subunit
MNRTKVFPSSSSSSSFLSQSSHVFRFSTLAIAISAAALLVACGGKEADKTKSDAGGAAPTQKTDAAKSAAAGASTARPVLTVNIAKPQVSDWPIRLSANGNIAAWQEAIVGAEANGLRLSEVRVNVGDQVKKGQVLATFSVDTSRADLAQLQANFAEAEASLAEAQANAARARTLQDSGALSAQQINQYLTAEKTAAARLASAKALTQSSELRLGFTRVVAPDEGVISARTATVGSVVAVGQELFRLIRQNRLEWRGEVTASELPKVNIAQKVTIVTPSGETVGGKVRTVAPTVDPQTRSALVYVDLEKSSAAKQGMFAKGEFDLALGKAIHVPQTAIVSRDGFTYVMRVEPNNKVTQIKVQTARRNGERVEIKEGVKEGEALVASGAAFLTEGDTVRVVDATPTATKPAAASAAPPAPAVKSAVQSAAKSAATASK